MTYQTATELAEALRQRHVSSSELVEASIQRIEALDERINAVVARDFERARAAARLADQALARGGTAPLLGVPITVKEAFNVAGLPTTWGLPGTEPIPVHADAVAVQRLKAAGAIIVGKTNIAAMLADWQCANPVYGVTRNPWDLTRTPGGSSGGGAAALAAGFVALEFGSDLSASLRCPAAFCGVYAHKPSFGLVPNRGFAPPGTPVLRASPMIDLSVVGPMARSAADLSLALDVTAGADEREAVAWRLQPPPPRHEALPGYRVFVLDQHPQLATAQSVRGALNERAAALEAAGCRIGRRSDRLPDLEAITDTFIALLRSMFSADNPGQGGGPSHADWIRADRRRAELAHQWLGFFEDWDVVLCPAMPTTALPLNPAAGPPQMIDVDGAGLPYQAQPLWAPLATLTGQPATTAPIGLDAAGLPIGAQIIGPFLEDRTPIAFAEHMERAFGGFVAPPGWS